MSKKTNLSVVANPEPDSPRPSCKLSQTGMSLWNDIVSTYAFEDRASYEVLAQACAAADRAANCHSYIDRDGEVVVTNAGLVRSHPLLRDELANRAFCCRSLQRLGLDLEPIRGVGRPSGR
jgi:hypothetical protein